jgi:hypothetical protein
VQTPLSPISLAEDYLRISRKMKEIFYQHKNLLLISSSFWGKMRRKIKSLGNYKSTIILCLEILFSPINPVCRQIFREGEVHKLFYSTFP